MVFHVGVGDVGLRHIGCSDITSTYHLVICTKRMVEAGTQPHLKGAGDTDGGTQDYLQRNAEVVHALPLLPIVVVDVKVGGIIGSRKHDARLGVGVVVGCRTT